jgi:hypothetical protein
MEDERVVRLVDEDPIEHERVEVDVKIEGPAEPLHAGHHARLATGESLPLGLAPIRGAQRPYEDPEHRPAQAMIVGEPVAQAVGHREHPLAHRHVGRKHVLDEVGGPLGHPPAATARAEAPPFAAEWHEPLERAVGAPHPREAVRQDTAAQELLKLVDDEGRQPGAVVRSRTSAAKSLQCPRTTPYSTPVVGDRGT